MRYHIDRCYRAVVASLMLAGLLLSACGRVAEGATPNSATPSLAPTAPALDATAFLPAAPLTLDGVIEQLAQERWVVAGTPVVLDAQTAITGTPALGAMAHIQGKLTTEGALAARTITIASSAATSTAAPTPATPAAATPLPAGSLVKITGVIENITVTNNITTVVVNSVTYVLPRNLVVMLRKRLRIGAPIVFVGQVDTAGQVIISNVVQINNQVLVIDRPRHHGENDDHQGDEGDD